MSDLPAFLYADDRACEGHTAVMYARGPHNDGTAAAKAICATCPHIAPCRLWAHAQCETYGVWGGEGAATRLAAIRGATVRHWTLRRRVAICGTTGGHRAHHERGEVACDACKDAWNAYKRRLRAEQAGRVA